MKYRILSAAVYAITAVALADYFDALYGAGPVTSHLGLIYSAIAGAVLFAVAFVLSMFTLRFGAICGLAACILSWPCFGIQLPGIPWTKLVSVAHYANWRFIFLAILMLAVSSAYSLWQLWLLFRPRGSN